MKKFFVSVLVIALLGAAAGFTLFWFKPDTFAMVQREVSTAVPHEVFSRVKSEVSAVASELWALKRSFFDESTDEVSPVKLVAVEKGEIFVRISTTGTVNPVSSVTVSTQVSGTIEDLLVDVTTEVREGDLIARLDQDLFHAEVLQAEARLEKARANLARERAGVEMLKAQIDASIAGARSSFKSLEDKFRRNQSLFKRQLISKEEFETIKADYELSSAKYREEAARIDEVDVKRANIRAMEAEVKQAQAELEIAKVKVSRSVIRAPIAGVIIEKTVEAGQTVAASLSSPPLVTIADLKSMKVDAWVDEAEIGKVRVGQQVEFQVDAYPNRIFHGEVVRIFPSPEIKDNVVTYDTEIRVANDDLALKPGMTANVTIVVARKDDVLVVPKSALRVRERDIRTVFPGMSGAAGQSERQQTSPGEARHRLLEGKGVVWVYRDGFPEPVAIRFGLADAKNMEILEGLHQGDEVITGIKARAKRSSEYGVGL